MLILLMLDRLIKIETTKVIIIIILLLIHKMN